MSSLVMAMFLELKKYSLVGPNLSCQGAAICRSRLRKCFEQSS
jgi:hypothetical protein